jgi:dihydrofolate reductase
VAEASVEGSEGEAADDRRRLQLVYIERVVPDLSDGAFAPAVGSARSLVGASVRWPRRYGADVPRKERKCGMAKLVFGMNQSLDGYVDHTAFAPSPTLFRHFIEEAQRQAGSVYGRQMYEVMRYWDDDHPEWDTEERAFAAAWRNQPKWVVSRSLKSVGPNARLVEDDLEDAIRELKAERDGEIEVAGPGLAQSLTELGLIDEYRIYLHPVVLGHGKPYFAGPRPPLRLMANDRIGEDVIRLTYVPA